MELMKSKATRISSLYSVQQQAAQLALHAKSDAAQGLHDLLLDELKDMFCAEKALIKALPKMIKNTTAGELIEALTLHLHMSKEHLTRIEYAFILIGEKAVAVRCEAMEGLILDAEEIVSRIEQGMVRDAAIIAAARKVLNFQLAGYDSLCSFSKTLGEPEAAKVFQHSINEKVELEMKMESIGKAINLETVMLIMER